MTTVLIIGFGAFLFASMFVMSAFIISSRNSRQEERNEHPHP